jgi:hypothetical protein
MAASMPLVSGQGMAIFVLDKSEDVQGNHSWIAQLQRLGSKALTDEKVSDEMAAFRVSLPLSSGSRAR